MIKGSKEKFIYQISDEKYQTPSSRKKVFRQKNFFWRKTFALMKTSDISVKNMVNKLLPAAFYHLTYQWDTLY